MTLAALAQPTRLAAFRMLVSAGHDGLAAGVIAEKLHVPQNTMSTHLAVLARAGLISGERIGRTIRYRIRVEDVRGLLAFLTEDCCGGHPELCGIGLPSRFPAHPSPAPCEAPCRTHP